MTKEALSEHEQAMEGLPGSEIDGQSQAVKVSTIGQLLLKGLAKSIVMGLSAFLRTLLHLEKKGDLSFCQTGCPEGADAGKNLNVWKSQLEKLKAIPDYQVIEKLKISYDSLQDDHDKNLFLHVACFFVGIDEDWVVIILDGCGFYTAVGIQNLIDRCLLTVDQSRKLVLHQLVQEMGREIVRQESPNEPGERSRLWNHKDSFNVLRENTGTRKIEGLKLDMNLLKEDKYDRTIFGVNRNRHYDEFLDMPLLSNARNSFKRSYFGFSKNVGTALGNSNQIPLEVDAFARMHKLKLLQLKYIQISGSFENFPKGLRWLCWHGFPFKSIPHDFPLENLIVLDMSYSRLQITWKGAKILESLKVLDLSHSHCLTKTPDFSKVPNLESWKVAMN
ncbi:hypothetical protein ACSBR2_004056 [Camellia fascicularis]